MTLDLSKVPHLEERQALLAKLDARAALHAKRDEISAPFDKQREPTVLAESEADDAAREWFKAVETEQLAVIADANAKVVAARKTMNEALTASGEAREAAEASITEAEEEALADINKQIEEFDAALYESLGGESHPWTIDEYGDDHIERCVLTGLPLRDDDALLEDEVETGGHFLYHAVPFPAQPDVSEEAKALAATIDDNAEAA